jgi:DNA-binding protein H-NS
MSKVIETLQNLITDISDDKVTLETLEIVKAELAKFETNLRETGVRARYEQFLKVAKTLGCSSLAELEQRVVNPGATVPKKRIIFPKYRDPDCHTNTWAGRGKPPRWMAERLAAGYKKEDFAI